MTEWKGPWKCEKCGQNYPNVSANVYKGKCQLYCSGNLVPHDRRAADPQVAALVEAELSSWCHKLFGGRSPAKHVFSEEAKRIVAALKGAKDER